MKQKDYLDGIILNKKNEVERLIAATKQDPSHPLHQIVKRQRTPSGKFAAALKGGKLAVIAEVKRRSPSRGEFAEIADPVDLAMHYCQGGATAISVLTDLDYFGGSLSDLQQVSEGLHVRYPQAATLRKDFIIHPLQLAEAAQAGAAAVLLIVRCLKHDLKAFLDEASRLGLEALTEIDEMDHIDIALNAGAKVIGVNNRNLATFQVDIAFAEKIRPCLPPEVITVSASGIHTRDDAKRMRDAGYDAVLVGEALVRSDNPAKLIAQMRELDDES